MYYEINVSKNGSHFFATHERSIQTREKLNVVYTELKRAFPLEEGYEISVRKMSITGEHIDMEGEDK